MICTALAGSGRISPPASDFDFEGISIIDLALNKYAIIRIGTYTYSKIIVYLSDAHSFVCLSIIHVLFRKWVVIVLML